MSTPTPYEQQQIRQIAGWKAEPPLLIVEIMETITHPIVGFAKRFIPENAVARGIDLAYKASEIFLHEEEIARRARVSDIYEMRDLDLETCDRLAEEFARKAGEGALMRGALVSSAGGVGALLGLEMMITFALKTVHTVGFCYGYRPEDACEREFALGVLLAAAAGSLAEKQRACEELQSLDQAQIDREALEEARANVAESVTEELTEEAVEQVSQSVAEDFLAERVIESTALRAVPLLGILVGAVSDAATAEYIGYTARRAFQERWLRNARKIESIAPDNGLARSRFSRARGTLGAGLYWTSFTLSFLVSYPPLFLSKLIPRDSAVARGCADGGHDANLAARLFRERVQALLHGNSEAAAVQPA